MSIDSVLKQTYKTWELLIIDDSSTDNSIEIIDDHLKHDPRIKLLKLSSNIGPAGARNKAIELAEGRFIAFLDSDDLWYPNKLEKQIQFMLKTGTALSYSAYQKIDSNDQIVGRVIMPPEVLTYKKMLTSCYIGNSTAVYDTSLLGKRFVPDIRTSEDHALWLSILREGYSARGILEPLMLYRLHKSALSRNKIRKAYYQWLVYRKIEKLHLMKCIYYMFNYSFFGLIKYLR
jgi:glycosyltransferase involved in cell wall biosynthesis